MSTPDEPGAPQLTRRQLRELRNTASTPVITPDDVPAAAEPKPAAPLPRAAEPAVVADEPPAAADVDLDAPALTRREARRQERLRTASVPVIDADGNPQGEHADASDASHDDAAPEVVAPAEAEAESEVAHAEGESEGERSEEHAPTAADAEVSEPEPAEEDAEVSEPESEPAEPEDAVEPVVAAEVAADALAEAQSEAPDVEIPVEDEHAADEPVADEPAAPADEAPSGVEAAAAAATDAGDDEEERPVVAPTFGSELLAGDGVEIELPASFDQLLSRGSAATGSISASNALILSQTPDTGSFASPVTATGEVLITGTFALPESLGSAGTTQGSSDGKDIDAILVDGELPASSSPTPIAASSAISTIKSAEDIIKPPAPEKGSRLMLALVITAGALALALTGALIVALVTGVFR
ncbi:MULTISPECIES: hypothetical protein [unclassified Microbacterium]|uniref:hypothetical protein n=1 Tax=unclassified Microbacterium TaxID=2609290 RepID=UPI00301876C4